MATITKTRARKLTREDRLRMPDWGAAGWAGIAGGGLFLALELLLLPRTNAIEPWEFIRMVAAIVLGPSALTVLEGQEFFAFVMAMTLHFSLSLVYMHLVSIATYRRTRAQACGFGLLFGIGLYLVNFHAFTGLFPWFVAARGWASLLSNAAFGLFSAWLYKTLETREPLIEDRPGVNPGP